jgi:outer membrane protein assembly factor BamD (BamD/ComL family)
MRYDRFNPDLNARLHDLYVKKGDSALTLAHGVQWLAALVRAERANAAYDALRALQAIDPAFALEDGDAVLPIAKVAVQKRDFALAIQIMRDFDKRFPKHKDTAGLLFLNAKIASEHLRKHDKAVKSLRSVLKHFPEDAIAAEARTYLTVLEKVLAQAPAPVSKTG